jgi:hypothetical protein
VFVDLARWTPSFPATLVVVTAIKVETVAPVGGLVPEESDIAVRLRMW